MEEYKVATTLWKILQEWLSKSSWDLEDEDEEEEQAGAEVEEEKPFPVTSSVLLVHMANKGRHSFVGFLFSPSLLSHTFLLLLLFLFLESSLEINI